MKRFNTLFIGVAFVLLVSACGDDDGAGTTSSSTPSSNTPATTSPVTTAATGGTADAAALVGTEWIVDGFVAGNLDIALVPDANPTVAFSADEPAISGTTGCNSYFASIDYGTDGEVTIGGVGQTEMACFPDDVMDQEQQFTQALSTIRVYDIDGDRLTLASADGSVIISAVNRDSVEQPVVLGDVVWIADTRIEGEAASTLVQNTEVRLTFDAALGNIGGNSGCNSFGATYVIDDDRIRIADIEGTERGCAQDIMEQERFLYDTLVNADTFSIDRNRLTIMTADGRGIGFTPGE